MAVGPVVVRHVDDELGVVGQARGAQRLPVAAQSRRGGAAHGLAPDGRDAASSLCHEVLGGSARGSHRVDGDVVEAGRHGPLAEQHHGQVVGPAADLVGREGERREDDAVDDVRPHPLEDDTLRVRVAAGHVEQHDEAECGRLGGDAGRQLGEVRRVHRRHGEGEEAGSTVLEAAGGEVGPIFQLGHGLFDPSTSRRLDVWVVVKHVGGRLDRHACALGDIAEPCRHSSSNPDRLAQR